MDLRPLERLLMASRAENFDPYHKWLGIPPDEQPANDYRLLGHGLFESVSDGPTT